MVDLRPTVGIQGAIIAAGQMPRGANIGDQLAETSGALGQMFRFIAKDREAKERAKAQTWIAQNEHVLTELMEGAERDAKALAEGGITDADTTAEGHRRMRKQLQRLVDAGVISKVDDPYFRSELLAAYGERAAMGVEGRVRHRMRSGETLAGQDIDGNPIPGKSFQEIWEEEVARSGAGVVSTSPLAAEAMNSRLTRSRETLVREADSMISQQEIDRLSEIRRDAITTSALGLLQAPSNEQMSRLREHIDALWRSNDPNWRQSSIDAVIRAANYYAIDDPQAALAFLNTVAQDIPLGPQKMGDNPQAALALEKARMQLLRTTDEKQTNELQERQRRQALSTSTVSGELLKALHAARAEDPGIDPVSLKQSLMNTLGEMMPNVHNEDQGVVRTDAERIIDAALEHTYSNRQLVNQFMASIVRAYSRDDIYFLEQDALLAYGRDLWGSDVLAVQEAIIRQKELINGGHVERNPAFARGLGPLNISPPQGLSVADTHSIASEIRKNQGAYTEAVMQLIEAGQGIADPARINELAARYADRANNIVREAAERVEKSLDTAQQNIRDGKPLGAETAHLAPAVVRDLEVQSSKQRMMRESVHRDVRNMDTYRRLEQVVLDLAGPDVEARGIAENALYREYDTLVSRELERHAGTPWPESQALIIASVTSWADAKLKGLTSWESQIRGLGAAESKVGSVSADARAAFVSKQINIVSKMRSKAGGKPEDFSPLYVDDHYSKQLKNPGLWEITRVKAAERLVANPKLELEQASLKHMLRFYGTAERTAYLASGGHLTPQAFLSNTAIVQHTNGRAVVEVDTSLVNPWTSRIIQGEAALANFENWSRRDEFYAAIGLTSESEQGAWFANQVILNRTFNPDDRSRHDSGVGR